MSSYIFNYSNFYKYYTNPDNVVTNKNDCVVLLFFNKSDKKVSDEKKTGEKCNYIIIDGIKIYITKTDKGHSYIDKNGETMSENTNGLLFSIPTLISDKLFDFHYHFGIRHDDYKTLISDSQYITTPNILNKNTKLNKTRRSRKPRLTVDYNLSEVEPTVDKFHINHGEKLIYFHKTIQEPSNGKGSFKHIDCYFQDNTLIQSINNIVCINKDKTIMGKEIKDYNDRQLLHKIMMTPFASNGGKQKTKKTKKTKL